MALSPSNRALWQSLRQNRPSSVRSAIESGADVNTPDEQGHTPLHFAVTYSLTKIAGQLLAAGAATDRADRHGQTPLHRALWREHIQMIRLLLKHGADPNQPDGHGQAPLDIAIATNLPASVQVILATGGKPAEGWDALTERDSVGWNPEIARLLARAQLPPEEPTESLPDRTATPVTFGDEGSMAVQAMFRAIGCGNFPELIGLLRICGTDSGRERELFGTTAAEYAQSLGHRGLVAVLELFAAVQAQDRTGIRRAMAAIPDDQAVAAAAAAIAFSKSHRLPGIAMLLRRSHAAPPLIADPQSPEHPARFEDRETERDVRRLDPPSF